MSDSPEYHWRRLKELLDIKDYTLQDMFEDIRRRRDIELDKQIAEDNANT